MTSKAFLLLLIFSGTTQLFGQSCTRFNDIKQTSNNGASLSSRIGHAQSWEANCTGQIESFAIRTEFISGTGQTINTEIFIIEGNTGNVGNILKNFNYSFVDAGQTGQSHTIEIPNLLNVTAGQEYSFVIIQTAEDISFQYSTNNPYADGNYSRISDLGDPWNQLSTWDLDFDIIVKDDPPFIGCRNITLTLDANGQASTTFGALSTGSGDDLGVTFRTISKSNFTCEDVGSNVVELFIQDTGGQNAFCDAIVTVIDGTAPELTCPGDITVGVDPGSTEIIVTYDDIVYSDCTVETPDGFSFLGVYTDPDGDIRNYYLSDNTIELEDGENLAEALGGFLVTVIDEDHNNWIRRGVNFLTGANNVQVLLGYTDRNNEGPFFWHAGNENAGYENWNSGEPNNSGDEDFAVQLGNGLWNDLNRNQERRYIIQLPPSTTSTITQTTGLPSGSEFPIGTTTNTFEARDANGNIGTCSFTVTVEENPYETSVVLNNGKLTITDIENDSDDQISMSSNGTTLTISNLVLPTVSGGPTLADATTVTVSLASITSGIEFLGGNGFNSITFDNDLTLTGVDNDITLNELKNYTQNGSINIEGDFTIANGFGFDLLLGELTTNNLTIDGVDKILDQELALTITGVTQLQAVDAIQIDNGQSRHSFTGEVNLTAGQVTFTAGANTTFGSVTVPDTGDGLIHELTVSPGNIIFNGNVTVSGSNANLFVCGNSTISQTSGIIKAPFLILRGNGISTAATLNNDNEVQALATSNPFDANAVDLVSLSFTNSTNMFLEVIHVNEFDLSAPEFDLEPNFTEITKEGTGISNFNANIDVNSGSGTVRINHNAGTINFNGESNDFENQFTYNGLAGTVTNINSLTTDFPFGGPNRSFTFGTINGTGAIDIGDIVINLLDGANFSGASTLLTGFPFITGGPTVIENGATITPSAGPVGFGLSYNVADLSIISGAIFAPLVEGTASDEHDVLNVDGTVTLINAVLAPIGGYTIQAGDEIIIIDNDEDDAVNGIFENLPEGSGISFGDFVGIISYVGGDGNDVVLVPDTVDPVAICQDITLTVGIDGITVTGDQLDGGSTDNVAISSILIDGQASIDYTFDDFGDNEVTITVVDASGNTTDCTATITLVSNVNATLPIVISEFQPLPTESNNGPNQTIEIKGASGESFVGTFVIIDGSESRSDRGRVVNATDISGTFNAEGILTASVPNYTNPTHTAVLTSAFSGTVDSTDIDTDNDGTADDLSAFGIIFDAVGVKDGGVCCPVNVTYGGDFGGIDLPNIGSPPAAIFRDASTGDFYQISSLDVIYDPNGAIVDASIFNTTPTVDGTFGTINPSTTSQVIVSPTIYLQGAFTNPNAGEETLMRDDLRVANLLPITSPYGDDTAGSETFFDTGNDNTNIVDWVWVELRDATDSDVVIDGQSALLRRNGDIVALNNNSALSFNIPAGDYFVAISHRNHLGVITANPITLSETTTTLDFTSDITIANGETLALTDVGNGIFAMYAGDATGDGNILNTDISNAISNSGGINVYSGADANMDGNILNTDIALIIQPNAGRIQQF